MDHADAARTSRWNKSIGAGPGQARLIAGRRRHLPFVSARAAGRAKTDRSAPQGDSRDACGRTSSICCGCARRRGARDYGRAVRLARVRLLLSGRSAGRSSAAIRREPGPNISNWPSSSPIARTWATRRRPRISPGAGRSNRSAPAGPAWCCSPGRPPMPRARSNYSTLFNIRTMEPLIAGPPMVRALDELVAAAKSRLARTTSIRSRRPCGRRSGKAAAAWR